MAKETSVALIVKKGALERECNADYSNHYSITREQALEALISEIKPDDIVVSTTGKLSRELFEIRERRKSGHSQDFLTVGSMGHASMIALGIALEKPDKTVWCLDGDGAAVMHMGSMEVLAQTGCTNLMHVVFNNGAHETVGGMPVAYGRTDFEQVARAMGYTNCLSIDSLIGISDAIQELFSKQGTKFLEIKVANGARTNLGRPTLSPIENRNTFMQKLTGAEGDYI